MNKFILLIVMLVLMFSMNVINAELLVTKAWFRLMPPVAKNTAAYFTLTNSGSKSITLTAVSSELAEKITLHEMVMEEGMMHMRALSSVIIDAGKSVSFTPSGKHLMLTGLKQKLKAGEGYDFQFMLADGQSVRVNMQGYKLDPYNDSNKHSYNHKN